MVLAKEQLEAGVATGLAEDSGDCAIDLEGVGRLRGCVVIVVKGPAEVEVGLAEDSVDRTTGRGAGRGRIIKGAADDSGGCTTGRGTACDD